MDSALMKAAYVKMAGEPRTVVSIVGPSAMENSWIIGLSSTVNVWMTLQEVMTVKSLSATMIALIEAHVGKMECVCVMMVTMELIVV
jgi:hypothetical protein